jgi:alkanesulfonate monooxygenase SsuD/methylene tetrahydromethanopterin reductase-like flavin-dependent oxidoreductase (luciferase family)
MIWYMRCQSDGNQVSGPEGTALRARSAVVTSRIRLSTAVALPTESDPVALAKTIATLDHLSGGRVTVGAGFGWNTDELADHGVPAGQRRTVLREYIEAMRALWTQEEAAYDGEFVKFGPCWAFPKPAQAHVPLIIGAGGGPRTSAWAAAGATELLCGLPDAPREMVEGYLDRLADRVKA